MITVDHKLTLCQRRTVGCVLGIIGHMFEFSGLLGRTAVRPMYLKPGPRSVHVNISLSVRAYSCIGLFIQGLTDGLFNFREHFWPLDILHLSTFLYKYNI